MLSTSSAMPSSDEDGPPVATSEIQVLFPEISEGKIRTEDFLVATRGVVRIVEKLGKVFAPVKYDIQGNIHKLAARHERDKEKYATLQDMILDENISETKQIATDALIWLTRGLHMILLFFEKIFEDTKTEPPTEDLVAFLKQSYKEALEPYHGWMAQQLFDLLSRMVPTRTQLLRALASKEEVNEHTAVLKDMGFYLIRLRENVSAIQSFCKTHNLQPGKL